MKRTSQEDKIYKLLMSGKSITPLIALRRFGIMRLGARIYALREQGVKINTVIIKQRGKRYAEYSIPQWVRDSWCRRERG